VRSAIEMGKYNTIQNTDSNCLLLFKKLHSCSKNYNVDRHQACSGNAYPTDGKPY